MVASEYTVGGKAEQVVRIAIVDDEVMVSRAFADNLRRQGWNVTEADNPSTLKGMISRGEQFDVVFLDWEFRNEPGSGLDLLDWIAAREDCKDLYVVIVSAHGAESLVRTSLLRGAADFIIKNLEFDQLAAQMARRVLLGLAWRRARRKARVLQQVLQDVAKQFGHDLANIALPMELAVRRLSDAIGQIEKATADPLTVSQIARASVDRIGDLLVNIKRLRLVQEDLSELGRSLDIFPASEDVDLNEILENRAKIAILKVNDVELSLSAGLPRIRAHRNLLMFAFAELVQNALKAMPHGGRLRLGSLCDRPGYVVGFVEDTGVGIEPQRLSLIFNSNHTSWPAAGEVHGTGLGLYLVKNYVVDIHCGWVKVSSVLGEGTQFEVGLPIGISF